jgi:hypothetical protein
VVRTPARALALRGAAFSLAIGMGVASVVTFSVPGSAAEARPSAEPLAISPPPLPLPEFPLVPVTAAPAPVDAAAPTPTAEASKSSQKVTLCHASSSASSPYQLITVAASALNGHDGHTGPVFDPATNHSGDKWGDIIPAVDDYPGQNNSGSGAEILANGCAIPTRPVDPSQPIVPITPTVPAKPVKPTPVKPITPTVPAKPVKPTPVKPITPTVPTVPAKPPRPAKPITPTVPTRPGVPQVPVVPGLPGSDRFLVTLCHATGSIESPYRRTIVLASSLAELQHDIEIGHGTHEGATFDPNTNSAGSTWGDVIPAFAQYPGLNNTGAGADILANGCDVPASVGVNPVAWNICHWDASVQPPAYVRQTVTAPTTQELLGVLGTHAAEVGPNGERDVIPTTRAGSADLACPGLAPAPTPGVTATVTVKSGMCHAEDGVYAKRFEVAVESASGATAAAARQAASTKASARLVQQLRYHSRHDRADVIEPFGSFDGFQWGVAGQRIFYEDCVVKFEPRNIHLLRPLPGVVLRPTASSPAHGVSPAAGK